jgi:hypothetical protein
LPGSFFVQQPTVDGQRDSQQPAAIARRPSLAATIDVRLSTFKVTLNVESRKLIDGGAQRRYNLDVERWLLAVGC